MSTDVLDDLTHAYQKAVRDLQHANSRQRFRRNSVLRAWRKMQDRRRDDRKTIAGLRSRVEVLETGLRQMRDQFAEGAK